MALPTLYQRGEAGQHVEQPRSVGRGCAAIVGGRCAAPLSLRLWGVACARTPAAELCWRIPTPQPFRCEGVDELIFARFVGCMGAVLRYGEDLGAPVIGVPFRHGAPLTPPPASPVQGSRKRTSVNSQWLLATHSFHKQCSALENQVSSNRSARSGQQLTQPAIEDFPTGATKPWSRCSEPPRGSSAPAHGGSRAIQPEHVVAASRLQTPATALWKGGGSSVGCHRSRARARSHRPGV